MQQAARLLQQAAQPKGTEADGAPTNELAVSATWVLACDQAPPGPDAVADWLDDLGMVERRSGTIYGGMLEMAAPDV